MDERQEAQNTAFTALDLYPGDDVVDVIGAHYYDSGPEKNTQALWDEYYRTFNGGPWGIGTWLAFAREHGKRLGMAEWGVWDQGQGARADDPVYMDNMYRSSAPTPPTSRTSCPPAVPTHRG